MRLWTSLADLPKYGLGDKPAVESWKKHHTDLSILQLHRVHEQWRSKQNLNTVNFRCLERIAATQQHGLDWVSIYYLEE